MIGCDLRDFEASLNGSKVTTQFISGRSFRGVKTTKVLGISKEVRPQSLTSPVVGAAAPGTVLRVLWVSCRL